MAFQGWICALNSISICHYIQRVMEITDGCNIEEQSTIYQIDKDTESGSELVSRVLNYRGKPNVGLKLHNSYVT